MSRSSARSSPSFSSSTTSSAFSSPASSPSSSGSSTALPMASSPPLDPLPTTRTWLDGLPSHPHFALPTFGPASPPAKENPGTFLAEARIKIRKLQTRKQIGLPGFPPEEGYRCPGFTRQEWQEYDALEQLVLMKEEVRAENQEDGTAEEEEDEFDPDAYGAEDENDTIFDELSQDEYEEIHRYSSDSDCAVPGPSAESADDNEASTTEQMPATAIAAWLMVATAATPESYIITTLKGFKRHHKRVREPRFMVPISEGQETEPEPAEGTAGHALYISLVNPTPTTRAVGSCQRAVSPPPGPVAGSGVLSDDAAELDEPAKAAGETGRQVGKVSGGLKMAGQGLKRAMEMLVPKWVRGTWGQDTRAAVPQLSPHDHSYAVGYRVHSFSYGRERGMWAVENRPLWMV